MPTIHDQIAHLPLIPDDFPEMTGGAPAKPPVVFPRYSKDWWLQNHGVGMGFRLWHNPTRDRQTLTFKIEIPRWVEPASIKEEDRCVTVVIEPGDTIELPKIWDRAILVVRNGEVFGGMAPRLRPVGVNLALCDGLQHFDGDPFTPKGAV